jgi:hypothetical protein
MVSGSKVQPHIQGFPEGSKEVGDEFGTLVRGYMGWNSMFREDMEYEQFSELRGCDRIVCGDEYGLLHKSINDDEDGSIS